MSAGARDVMDIIDMTSTLDSVGLRENKPNCIVLHSTRSYREFGELHEFHRKRGFAGVGYHYFVTGSKVYQARPVNLEGAHALGFNTSSIAICVYSKDGTLDKEPKQFAKEFIKYIRVSNGGLVIISHTSAQLAYIDQILSQAGSDMRFSKGEDVTNQEAFSKINAGILKFLQQNPDCETELRKALTGFKNCPGPMFTELI